VTHAPNTTPAKSTQWKPTPELLQEYCRSRIETVRQNALKRGSTEIVAMCDAELANRVPAKKGHAAHASPRHSSTDFVSEYHFVCAGDRGVTVLSDGRFKTGSWVVAEATVIQSLRYGAIVALHESRSTPSYRQGRIVDFALTVRNMLAENVEKTETGIEFLVVSTPEPLNWIGDATGEKGYRWEAVTQSAAPPARGGI
jgi:hypothetical protein